MAFLKGFLQLFSAPPLDSTEVQKDDDLQYKCRSCRYTLKNLFVALRDLELQQRFFGKPLGPIRIHENYQELAACAQQCVACRTFRKALIIKQHTTEDAAKLEEATEAVFVTLLREPSTDVLSLRVSIGRRRDDDHASALVSCTASNDITSPSLHPNPRHPSVAREAKSWLDTCTATHTECGNLRSSTSTPTRLLEILADSQSVQLIHPNQHGTTSSTHYPYVALSYCWGPPPSDPIPAALVRTTLTTPANLSARCSAPFPTSTLTPTLRDTIAFVAALGTRYIWIDALCIVQGPGGDWETESAKMHEVYGNAAYTLCIASNDAATKPLFSARTAWKYKNVPCRLAGSWWIAAYEVGVEELRRKAPLAKRAWTLQEERLSPRVLYWSGQRMYWSGTVMVMGLVAVWRRR
ncbi:hypothetical protein DBV05_g10041 [Lasiodiplodia theobromae]|uniref:Heterokaryon incompatibility domain-containing protein n=1 Tax=Lasiodiplodia theobromae TaxID=45133 RepID=A0A5N5D0X8_9PEZI|nr:hypothetical protein DBV05_g10041 [Lasiodiplodia theobromae]